MTNTAFIEFRGRVPEEIRGYSSVDYVSGGVSFLWSDSNDRELWYNLSDIVSISYQEEPEYDYGENPS